MAKAISIGALRERVELQLLAESKDGMGAAIQTPGTIATVWAEVRPASSGETWRRQQLQANATWTVVIRYRADVTPQMRVLWTNPKTNNAHTFQVKGIESPDQRQRFMELACEELAVGAQ